MASIGNITFAAEDPARLAEFWAAALQWEVQETPAPILEAIREEGLDPNMAAAVVDPEGRGPRLFFEKKTKSATETLPIHLDLSVDDRDASVKRLQGLGATVVGDKSLTIGGHTSTWTVMHDPEGNGFCVQG
jgi:predicted enzyme related to lactoylglutathione lyase